MISLLISTIVITEAYDRLNTNDNFLCNFSLWGPWPFQEDGPWRTALLSFFMLDNLARGGGAPLLGLPFWEPLHHLAGNLCDIIQVRTQTLGSLCIWVDKEGKRGDDAYNSRLLNVVCILWACIQ